MGRHAAAQPRYLGGVGKSWKGVSEERTVVRGYGPEVSCGIEFREGERYLVYARDNEG